MTTLATRCTITSRDLTRNFAAAKRSAVGGPVVITDHGRPAFALLSIDDYNRLAREQPISLLDAMDAIACDEAPDLDAVRRAVEIRTTDYGEDVR